MKYYYSGEYCDYICDLEGFKIILKEEDLEEILLEEMKRDIGGEMYCKNHEIFVEKGDCGIWCSMYSPCNGVSGRCRNLENGFVGSGKKFILGKNGLTKVLPIRQGGKKVNKPESAIKEIREVRLARERKENEEKYDKWFQSLSDRRQSFIAYNFWDNASFEDKKREYELE
jgi:hypothetical protein